MRKLSALGFAAAALLTATFSHEALAAPPGLYVASSDNGSTMFS